MNEDEKTLFLEYDKTKIYFKNIGGDLSLLNEGNNKFILRTINTSSPNIENVNVQDKKLNNVDSIDYLIKKIDDKIRDLESKNIELYFNIEKNPNFLNKELANDTLMKYLEIRINELYKDYHIDDIIEHKFKDNLILEYKITVDKKELKEYFLIKNSLCIHLTIENNLINKYSDLIIEFLLSASFETYDNKQLLMYYDQPLIKVDKIESKIKSINYDKNVVEKYAKEFKKIDNLINNYTNSIVKNNLKHLFNYLILGDNPKDCNNICKKIHKTLYKLKIINNFKEITFEEEIQEMKEEKEERFFKKINNIINEFDYIAILGFEKINEKYKRIIINKLIDKINKGELVGIIISDSDSEDIVYKDYLNLFLNFNLKINNIDDIYEMLLNKLNQNHIKYNFEKQDVINDLKQLYYCDKFKNETFVDNLFSLLVKNKMERNLNIISRECFPKINNTKIKKLEELVGLEDVKNDIKKLEVYWNYKRNDKRIYINSVFTGNPGTGKSTVAKIVSHKLYELGYIKENKFIEVTPNDLIGQYLGHTAKVINNVLKKAKNGVLFIDEAYLLLNNNEFFQEALVELLKYMETPKMLYFLLDMMNK